MVARLSPVRWALPCLLAATAIIVVTTRPGVWGRMPFTDTWFGESALHAVSPATFVLSANAPLAYISAEVPQNSRVIRIAGTMPIDPDRGIGPRVRGIIASSSELRSVHDGSAPDDDAALQRFGLRKVRGSCEMVRVKIDPLEICRLERVR